MFLFLFALPEAVLAAVAAPLQLEHWLILWYLQHKHHQIKLRRLQSWTCLVVITVNSCMVNKQYE